MIKWTKRFFYFIATRLLFSELIIIKATFILLPDVPDWRMPALPVSVSACVMIRPRRAAKTTSRTCPSRFGISSVTTTTIKKTPSVFALSRNFHSHLFMTFQIIKASSSWQVHCVWCRYHLLTAESRPIPAGLKVSLMIVFAFQGCASHTEFINRNAQDKTRYSGSRANLIKCVRVLWKRGVTGMKEYIN